MKSKAILTIILIALLTPTVSAFEVGILKIDTPSRVMAGEQAEIKVTDLITGNSVSGADVQINGAKIGTTGSSGTLTYTFERGLYTITATKFGYTPAASLSLSVVVPDISTPTPTPTPTPEIYTPIPTPTEPPLEEINGLVISFKSGGQMQELAGMMGLSTIPGVLITNNNNYMLLGETALETGNYDVKGRALKSFYFDNKNWVIFNMVESNRLPPTTITFSELKNNPERYLLKEVSVKATIKEVSATVDLEIVKVPVSIGILTDKPADPFKFTEELIESAKDFQKEPSWEKAKLILQDYEGIAVYRAEESYWKSTEAETTGFLLTPELIDTVFNLTYLDITNIKKLIPGTGVILLGNNVIIPAEKTSIEDIIQNPAAYRGKVVEVEINGIGSDISVKRVIQLAAASTLAGAPVAALSEIAMRFNAYIQTEILWSPRIPEANNLLFSTGIKSYSEGYGLDIGINAFEDLSATYIIKGAVVSSAMLNESLPDEPMILIYEKEQKTTIPPIDISEDVREVIDQKLKQIINILEGKQVTYSAGYDIRNKNPSYPDVELKSLTVTTPETISAKSGETINLNLGIDWEPQDWQGTADITIILSAAGFDTKYELPNIHLEKPPISNTFDYKLPDNLPPLTYTAKIIVDAGEIMAQSSTDVETGNASMPGFESFLAIVALLILARVRD